MVGLRMTPRGDHCGVPPPIPIRAWNSPAISGWRAAPTKEVITMSVGISIPSDVKEPLVAKNFHSLSDYQRAVGGYIEAISLGHRGIGFFANEEAKLIGLRFNWRATMLWWLHQFPDRSNDAICGDVVLVGPADERGATQSLPDWLRLLLLTASTFAVEVKETETTGWQRTSHVFTDYFDACSWGLDFAWRQPTVKQIRVVAVA
ncbi:Domain of uncharacterised function (DUF3846) [Mycobacteroides abscessus]|nr:Domain of uncharacterised function (DUF3846) [Mycobacteroides abscessus]